MKIIFKDFYACGVYVDEMVADMPNVSLLENITIDDIKTATEEQVKALFN